MMWRCSALAGEQLFQPGFEAEIDVRAAIGLQTGHGAIDAAFVRGACEQLQRHQRVRLDIEVDDAEPSWWARRKAALWVAADARHRDLFHAAGGSIMLPGVVEHELDREVPSLQVARDETRDRQHLLQRASVA